MLGGGQRALGCILKHCSFQMQLWLVSLLFYSKGCFFFKWRFTSKEAIAVMFLLPGVNSLRQEIAAECLKKVA